MNYNEESLRIHKLNKGKLEVKSKVPLESKDDLSVAYTPGVAEPSRQIASDKDLAYTYTIKGNSVAVVSDGSAVLGLGDIGGEAAMPVMEGKALLFKEFANIDAFPICLTTGDKDQIIQTVKNISAGFGGINLEDIAAPKCFEIEEALQDIGIPVFHDDQHGTAVVILAALINASQVVDKNLEDLKVVISGAGAAGTATAKLLKVHDIIMLDSKGIIHSGRDNLNSAKESLLQHTNKNNISGDLSDALKDADVFIGVSQPNLVSEAMIKSMNENPIILAMANPTPEIMPEVALAAGAAVVGTGRSDFPNQVNNVLAFPGIFRGALDIRAPKITESMKLAAAHALAAVVKSPTKDEILPSPFNKEVVQKVAEAVKSAK